MMNECLKHGMYSYRNTVKVSEERPASRPIGYLKKRRKKKKKKVKTTLLDNDDTCPDLINNAFECTFRELLSHRERRFITSAHSHSRTSPAL